MFCSLFNHNTLVRVVMKQGKCAKQTTIAIIENHGQYWIGTNYCDDAQEDCPRTGLATGEGYILCKSVCEQYAHAEEDACRKAGVNAKGGTLYLIGHTYCCEPCKAIMESYGISEVIIGKLPQMMVDLVWEGL